MTRRGHGEGSITKREDGRWMARITVGAGKRAAFYGKTRREVQEQLTAALRNLQQGIAPKPGRQTLGQFLTAWLTDSVKQTVRPKTFESYSQLVRVHIAPSDMARRPLTKLTPQDLQSFLNKKLQEGLSPRTVQYLRAVLRRALGQALKWDMVARNVATLVDSPKVVRQEVRPLSPEQTQTFLEAARDDRLSALYTVALALGLRQGEAFGLRWEDVDLDRGLLRVSVALQRIGKEVKLVEPKTERSRRTIALPAFAVAALREHKKRQIVERLLAGSRWQGWPLVFTSTIGTPLDGHNLHGNFKKLLAKAGLPNIRFHDLRHTCASLLLAQGLSPRVIMETLGHSQISLTMNTYAHVMPALQREAADKMEMLFGG